MIEGLVVVTIIVYAFSAIVMSFKFNEIAASRSREECFLYFYASWIPILNTLFALCIIADSFWTLLVYIYVDIRTFLANIKKDDDDRGK